MEEEIVKSRVMGIDIGNEQTAYAIVDIRGNIIAENSFETSVFPNVNQFVSKLVDSMI